MAWASFREDSDMNDSLPPCFKNAIILMENSIALKDFKCLYFQANMLLGSKSPSYSYPFL